MPNIMRPQYKILPTDKTPTEATMAALVTATLKAGAVPATPMMMDSNTPSEFFANRLDELMPQLNYGLKIRKMDDTNKMKRIDPCIIFDFPVEIETCATHREANNITISLACRPNSI